MSVSPKVGFVMLFLFVFGFSMGVIHNDKNKPEVNLIPSVEQLQKEHAEAVKDYEEIIRMHQVTQEEMTIAYLVDRINLLSQLKCNFTIHFMENGSPKEAKFIRFLDVGEYKFLKLIIKGKKRDYEFEKFMKKAFRVDCKGKM